jgi:formylmethanofuran dehydrogenase subunit E
MSENENPMVVDAYHEYDQDGRKTGRNPYLQHCCDECNRYIYEDDDSFDLDGGETLCCVCWAKRDDA